MKALHFITAAVAFVATLGLVGCSNDGIVEFQPQDELDKAALAVAKEKYPDEKFYRAYEDSAYAKADITKGKVEGYSLSGDKDYDYTYNFVFFKDKNDKDKRFLIGIKCESKSNKCDINYENEDKIGNANKQGRTK